MARNGLIDYDAMRREDLEKLKGTPYEYTAEDQERWQQRADAIGAALSRTVVVKKPSKPRGPSEPEKEFLRLAVAARFAGTFIAVNYQPEPPFQLDGNTTYQSDFELVRPDHTLIYVETKGRRMTSESLTRMKLRQSSEKWPGVTWWLARWHRKLPWKVQVVEGGVIRRKPIEVAWLKGRAR